MQSRLRLVSRLGLIFGVGALLTGCGGDGGKSKPRLTPQEFALLPAEVSIEPDPATILPPGAISGPVAMSEGILDVRAVPGPPPSPKVEPSRVDTEQLVEATVGSINGKPIYASTFLDGLASALTAQGQELASRPRGREQWRAYAAEEIRKKLDGLIEDELLRAEAMSSLAPEQRQGFFAFVQSLQREEVSKSGGSIEAARRRVAESESLSLDQYLKQREQRALIMTELQRKVRRGVNVTWRDIQHEYKRTWEVWNPPPLAVFRMVQISTSTPATVEEFTTRLAGGESFESLASLPLNLNDSAKGGLREVRFKGEQTEAEFFGNPELNSAARSLSPGQTAGPIALGSVQAWLHLERIDRQHTELYDAQRKISAELFDQRLREEISKHVWRLRSRANMTSMNEMVLRLLAVAEERYYPVGE